MISFQIETSLGAWVLALSVNISLHVFYVSALSVEIWCQHWCREQNYAFWEEKHPSTTHLPCYCMLWKESTEPKWSNTNNKIWCTVFFFPSIFASKVNMEMKKNLTSCSLKFLYKIIIGCQQYSCPCFGSFLSHSLLNDYHVLDTYDKIRYFVKALSKITTQFSCKRQMR